MERWWNDFKLIWLAKRSRPKTLEELEQSVNEVIKYFNTRLNELMHPKTA